MISDQNLGQTLIGCRSETLSARLYRAVNLEYFRTLASTIGAKTGDNRFTPAGISDALYLAQTPSLAMLESSRQFQRLMGTPVFPAYTVIPVVVDLRRVLDMTRQENQDALGTSPEELTGDWRAANTKLKTSGRGRVVCHSLGRAALNNGFEAIKYASAYNSEEWNIVMFTENLLPESSFYLDLPEHVIALQEDTQEEEDNIVEAEGILVN